MRLLSATVFTGLLLAGCGHKTKVQPDAAASSSASPPANAAARPAAVDASAAPSAAASGAATSAGAASYAGTYSLAPATIHIAEGKDYAHVKQAKDDPSKLVGSGSLTLAVDGQGRVAG